MNDHDEGCGQAAAGGESGGVGGRQPAAVDPMGQAGQGEMRAHDIPRYSSEGYVLGRPEAANDPTSAGHIQGAPDAGSGIGVGNGAGAGYGQQPTGVGMVDGQTMAPGGPGQQQGMPAGAPGMGAPYGEAVGLANAQGMGPVQAQATAAGANGRPAEMQAPPQGAGYMGVDPAYGQAAYTAGAFHQPGYQVPPQGMDPRGMAGQACSASAGEFNANQYGRIAEVVNDIAKGEQPDMDKIVGLLNGFDTQFWKGALIGAVATLLVTNDAVKSAVSGTLGGIFGAFSKKPEPPATEAAE
jgi:hypothetical protein